MKNPLYTSASPDPRLSDLLTDYPEDLFTEQLYQSVALAQAYAQAHALRLLGELALVDALEEWQSAEGLLQRKGFVPHFYRSLVWLLQTAAEAGAVISRDDASGREYRLLDAAAPQRGAHRLTALRAIGLSIDPSVAATLVLLDSASAAYPDVATGNRRGEDALFGMGQLELWQAYFSNSHRLYAVNNRVSATAAALRLARLSASRPLRLLEIGAGTGSGSEALLDALAQRGLINRIERYVVSEPNAFFRRRAERALRARYPELPLTFLALDIDKAWNDALADNVSFDLVFAVNVMHVAKDIRFSLSQARDSLAEGGWLVAGECLRPFPGQPIYPELIFQVLESYTNVQTDPAIRPNPGFLTPEQWSAALTETGLAEHEIVPDPVRIRDLYRLFFVGALCARPSIAGPSP
jgi:SAM-dependent methyltransferase